MDFQFLAIFVNLIIPASTISVGIVCQLQERAIMLDREPVLGRLELHPTQGVLFRGSDDSLWPGRQLRKVESQAPSPIVPGTSPAHQVHLWGHESVSGQVEAIESEVLRVNSPMGERLSIPLFLVQKIAHFRGDAVLVRDDFEAELPLRHLAGSARVDDAAGSSGRRGVRFSQAGDGLQYQLPQPVGAGWLEARLFDDGEAWPALEWVCDLEFESQAGLRTLRVVLGWSDESYGLATPQGPSFQVQHIGRKHGWFRLGVRFAPDRTTILIDDAVLTHRALSVGALRAVRFLVQPGEDFPGDAAKNSKVAGFLDDFQIAATQGSTADRQPSPDQDDILLTSGDQLFGRVESATPSAVTIVGEFGSLRIDWNQIQAVHFTARSAKPSLVSGQRVRLEYAAASTYQVPPSDNDALEGVLSEVTDEFIRLEHPFIGAVRIRRAEMRSMDLVSSEHWLAIDPRFHHLGDQVNVRLQVPHPEGSERSWQFALDRVPETANLVLSVVEMNAQPAAVEGGKRPDTEDWRTFAEINGTLLDAEGLNHRLPVNYRGPMRLVLPIAAGILRDGDNVLRIYQTPQKDDPRSFDDCGIFGIGLEYSKD